MKFLIKKSRYTENSPNPFRVAKLGTVYTCIRYYFLDLKLMPN